MNVMMHLMIFILKEIDSSWFGFDEEINDQDQLNIEAATEEYEKLNGSTFKRLDEMLQTEYDYERQVGGK
ncbi:hypothetical protein M422DRAFT_251547 [Sphaerobolus stellatus SS14]|uniref:Uncharacterized protein n=1 Tax=Sphaerobolus stellatus (strain SS14) TaxID=990650 RepID=A0A0C9UPY2_SPHS4|nr:hypothetical protein M422DRAFT_251547 [Sphaerobolus stellatus SS14]